MEGKHSAVDDCWQTLNDAGKTKAPDKPVSVSSDKNLYRQLLYQLVSGCVHRLTVARPSDSFTLHPFQVWRSSSAG